MSQSTHSAKLLLKNTTANAISVKLMLILIAANLRRTITCYYFSYSDNNNTCTYNSETQILKKEKTYRISLKPAKFEMRL